jgi:hypothetical protein
MNEGIYRIEVTSGQVSSKGVAMVSNDIIRALDSGYIYVGSQAIKYGQRGWSFCAARYGKSQPGSSLQNFSATAYGQESDEEFWLCGESDADANIQVAIHGWRVAGLL